MERRRSINNAPVLWERILAQSPEELARNVRHSASECHSAVSKLVLRDEVAPNMLNQIQRETNDMLTAVNHLRDRLLFTDKQIQSLSQMPLVKRYLGIVRILENNAENLSSSERKSHERERDSILKEVSQPVNQLREHLRSSLVFRLEMIRYWKWFLGKAIEIYTIFKGVVRDSLGTICNQIEEPWLRELVRAVLADEKSFPSDLMRSQQHRFTPNLPDIDRQAVKELEDLCAVESQLQTAKESVAELENSESLIREEIQDSREQQKTVEKPTSKRILIRALEPTEKKKRQSNSPRVFERNHNK